MNFLKEVILNQLIRIPAVKERAKKYHQPVTKVTNKYLLPIYNQLMIYYSIQTLMNTGVAE